MSLNRVGRLFSWLLEFVLDVARGSGINFSRFSAHSSTSRKVFGGSVTNVERLINAGLIPGGAPSQADQDTINALDPTEVDGLIETSTKVAPGQNSRTIGIVF